MSTEQTKKDIELWQSEEKKVQRMKYLSDLSKQAGIFSEFCQIPPLRVMNWDVDKYWMNVLAMQKIVQLKRIADYQEVQCPI